MANPNPDPNNNTPNQNTTPINTSKLEQVGDKLVDFSGISLAKDTGVASRIGRSTIGASYKDTQNFDWAKFNEKLRQDVVNKEYDNLWTGAGKWVGSTLNSAATFLLDIGGALFDPADWRLPEVPAEVDSEFRESRGGYINGIFKYLDNNTIFGDTEDVTGNWLTRTASDWREYNEIYRTIKSGNEYADFWLNGSANVVGSALGTFGYGTLMKTTLQGARWGLRAAQGINATQQGIRLGEGISATQKVLSTGAGAFLMTQATGMSIAQGVHDEVYKQKLYDLSPNLKNTEEAEYERIYDEVLAKTKNAKDAEYAARMGVKEFRKNFASENPELHKLAIKDAGKGAEASLQMMFPAFLLNLTMSSAFTKSFVGDVSNKVTRNIISKSPYSKRAFLTEGLQETVEEAGVENIAEDYGIAVGLGKDYTVSDAWKKVMSWDNLGTAALAFMGGTATKAVIDFAGSGKHKKAYEEQQHFIKKWNEIGAAVGQPDVVEQLTAPVRSAQELNKILREIDTLNSQGRTEEAKEASKKILAIQAYDAYKSGTTKILIDNWTQIANSKDVKPEVRQAAKVAVQEILTMENDFNESLKYENGIDVFKNRINQKQDIKLTQELKNKIFEKRNETQLEVALLKQAGKLDLSYDYTVGVGEPTVNEESGELIFPSEKIEKGELDLELTDKGYVNKTAGRDASNQIKQIKEQVKPYQELLDLQEELEATEIRIAEHNSNYAKMTDKTLQKNLKYQNMVLQEYESMKGDLEESLGTDEYIKEVDSKILNYYKNKMTKDSFENFRKEFFVNKNNKEKATKELAEKVQLEEGLKSNEQLSEDAKLKEQNSVKEIPFANVPKETKIQLVARKLSQGIPLTAEEERFKNSNSIKVENKRLEYEKEQQSGQPATSEIKEEVIGEDGTVTDEKAQIVGNINNILESQPAPQIPPVSTKSKLDTLIDKHNPNLNEQQKAALEKELSKEKPNENLIASLLKVKKPVAQEIITQYKLNQEAVESNTDVDLINFTNDIKQQINASGQNSINFDLETEEEVDEFGETTDVLTEKGKAQLELIKRLKASNNTDLNVVPNKSIPNRYKFEIPLSNDPKEDSDAVIEDDFKSFDPKEINDRLTPETRNQLKEQIGDYLIALEEELGSEPTFEKFIRDYIVNSSKEQAKVLFDTLALGWELNGMPVENYKEIYDKVFKSRKEIANSLMQFAEEQNLVDQELKDQVNKANLENNTSKKSVETASGDTVFIPVPNLGDAVFRLGYNSTNVSARFTKVEDEEGRLVTLIESFEEDDTDNFINFKELLRRDRIKPGTQLSVQLGVSNLNTIFIKDRNDDGEVEVDLQTGKPILIQFGEWVKRNVEKKGMDFLNSQLYYDAVPLTVKDNNGNAVAYIHDVSKISTDDKLSAEQKVKQIADLRALRKYLIDTEKKGGTPKIEVTGKTGGKTEKYADGKPRRIRSVDKNAVLATGIVNNNNEVTHVYVSNGSKRIMPIAEFYTEFKIKNDDITNIQKQLQFGNTLDVRAWGENGEHHIFLSNFSNLNEELVESMINALSLGLNNETRKTLDSNLKAQLGVESIEKFISKFVSLKNPDKVNQGNSYFEIKDKNTFKILFGVKGGEQFVIETQEDFNKHKDKLIEFLSQQRLRVKNKLANPEINSNELKMGLVDEDGSIIKSNINYFEYLMKDAETNIRLENIGSAENPHFITRFQPNVEFKPVASPSRNSNNYSNPTPETKEENKQLNNLVANTFTDEQIAKEIPNLEAQGFEFIGNTTEEKVADAKKLLSENSNESTELAKQLDDNLKEKLEQKTEETQTPLEGFEEFFNIFAESSNVDEAIQKLIDNKTITKDCK